jgi:hypothetical protein
MENRKIIILGVILVFSQIIGLPGVYKIWTAVILGLIIIALGVRQSRFVKQEKESNQTESQNTIS